LRAKPVPDFLCGQLVDLRPPMVFLSSRIVSMASPAGFGGRERYNPGGLAATSRITQVWFMRDRSSSCVDRADRFRNFAANGRSK
jgi:hypothetical protein